MRIEWLFPFIENGEYLVWASVCRHFRNFLLQRRYPKFTDAALIITNEKILEWAIMNGLILETKLYDSITKRDNAILLELMLDNNVTYTNGQVPRFIKDMSGPFDISCNFVKHQAFRCLDVLVDRGFKIGFIGCRRIIEDGDMEKVIKYFPHFRYKNFCETAIINKRLDIAEFFVENGAELGYEILIACIRENYAEGFRWALEHGCPLYMGAVVLANRSGIPEIRQAVNDFSINL